MERSRRAALMLLALATLLVTACAGPTVSDHAMRSQASRSAESAVSEVETIRQAIEAQLDGNAWWRYTDVVVTSSESALSSIESTLSSRQPPTPESAQARQQVVAALGDAADLATSVRIAVRDHDTSKLQASLADLGKVSDQLSALEQDVK
jgi:hypothetical protein